MRSRRRLVVIAIGIFACFSLLSIEFFKIQIQQGDKWEERAERQHYFTVKEPFRRGVFYSNVEIKKGHPNLPQPFVIDVQKFHLFADPMSIPEIFHDEIGKELASLLELGGHFKVRVKEHLKKKCRSRILSMWISKEKKDEILSWWRLYAQERGLARNSLFFTTDYQRSYPFGKLLGQVLHTVRDRKEEITKQAVPTGGLELSMNTYLQGKQGKRKLMRSPRNSLETGEILVEPIHGANIHLTINHYIQAIAEKELEKGVKRSHSKGGWAVVLDPRTGHILAMAQYPFFYPQNYTEYFNNSQLESDTRVRAVMDTYEPGSILKPFTMATALLANDVLRWKEEPPLFDPDQAIITSENRFPGRSKPIREAGRYHRRLNMDMAILKSSNIYAATLAKRVVERLGNNWFRSVWEESFGFGKKTNVELPAEQPGLLPRIGYTHPNGALEWSQATPYSLAMGHNIQLNALQIVRAYALLANGGWLVEPTLIKKIIREDQVIVDHTKPEYFSRFRHVLNSNIVERVIKAMRFVTTQGRGDVPGYTEVGKSGTSMKVVNGKYSERHHYASFVGISPLDEDALVILVTLDEPEVKYIPGVGKNHFGGVSAAPIFREIAKRALEYLGVKPDDPYGYPKGDPRYDRTKASWVLETERLQEKYNSWNK